MRISHSDLMAGHGALQWDRVENKTAVVIYGAGALTLLWFSSTIVGAVNNIPLVCRCAASLTELAGPCVSLDATGAIASRLLPYCRTYIPPRWNGRGKTQWLTAEVRQQLVQGCCLYGISGCTVARDQAANSESIVTSWRFA